ncbi:hypothetical protein J6590_079632 [Homalodisca vitripennis]|nr:hypothetical protein J6590_079632 [Homalodisca vitripennis]
MCISRCKTTLREKLVLSFKQVPVQFSEVGDLSESGRLVLAVLTTLPLQLRRSLEYIDISFPLILTATVQSRAEYFNNAYIFV